MRLGEMRIAPHYLQRPVPQYIGNLHRARPAHGQIARGAKPLGRTVVVEAAQVLTTSSADPASVGYSALSFKPGDGGHAIFSLP